MDFDLVRAFNRKIRVFDASEPDFSFKKDQSGTDLTRKTTNADPGKTGSQDKAKSLFALLLCVLI